MFGDCQFLTYVIVTSSGSHLVSIPLYDVIWDIGRLIYLVRHSGKFSLDYTEWLFTWLYYIDFFVFNL